MTLSQQAQQALDRIKAKIEIKAIDFKGAQLNDLAVVYFEVTQAATGKGRVLSKGCVGCIPPAVHICYNYLQTIPKVEEVKAPESLTVQVDEWDDLTRSELISQCKDRDIRIPRNATKQQLIDLLNGK